MATAIGAIPRPACAPSTQYPRLAERNEPRVMPETVSCPTSSCRLLTGSSSVISHGRDCPARACCRICRTKLRYDGAVPAASGLLASHGSSHSRLR